MFKNFFLKKFIQNFSSFIGKEQIIIWQKYLVLLLFSIKKKQTYGLRCEFSSGLTHADLSSMYPSVMRTERFPMG